MFAPYIGAKQACNGATFYNLAWTGPSLGLAVVAGTGRYILEPRIVTCHDLLSNR